MKAPWHDKGFDGWLIVGMNHYSVNGRVQLFVALTKNGRCIKEEGNDDEYLWNRLWHKAREAEREP